MNSRTHNSGKTGNPNPDAFHRLGTARRGTLLRPEIADKVAARILGSKSYEVEPPIGHWEQHEQN